LSVVNSEETRRIDEVEKLGIVNEVDESGNVAKVLIDEVDVSMDEVDMPIDKVNVSMDENDVSMDEVVVSIDKVEISVMMDVDDIKGLVFGKNRKKCIKKNTINGRKYRS